MGKKKVAPKADYSELPNHVQEVVKLAIKNNNMEWGSALTELGLVPKPIGDLTYSPRYTPARVAVTFDKTEASSVLEEQDRCLKIVVALKNKEITMEECMRLIRTNQMQKLRTRRQSALSNGGSVRKSVGLV